MMSGHASNRGGRSINLRDKMLNGQVGKCALLLARDGAHQSDTGACSCCPCGERRANPRHALC